MSAVGYGHALRFASPGDVSWRTHRGAFISLYLEDFINARAFMTNFWASFTFFLPISMGHR